MSSCTWYEIKNTGMIALSAPFTITDDRVGTFPCSGPTTLAPGASVTCTANYVIQPGDLGDDMAALPTGVNAIVSTGEWLKGTTSSFDVSMRGATGVPDGTYSAWCVEVDAFLDLQNEPGTLYSTIGGNLPPDVAGLPWNTVNYVLNHKFHGPGRTNVEFIEDVQTAIWLLLGQPPDPSIGVSAAAQQMIDAANAHPDFVPGQGDVVAIIVYSDGMSGGFESVQECILEMKPLQTITNHAVATAKAGSATLASNRVEATVSQLAQGAPVGPMDAVASGHQLAGQTVTTDSFSTSAGNELLLAFIAADYEGGTNTSVTRVNGAGLAWQLVVRANVQRGTSEIWRAFAEAPLANVAVTATLSQAVSSSITVITFRNVDTSGSNGSGAIGAIASGNGASGAPTVTLMTTRDNSWVFGVGNDFDDTIGRTVGSNQALVFQYFPPAKDTYWVQRTGEISKAGATTVLNDLGPTTDRWNFAAVEIVASGPPPQPVAVPNVVNLAQAEAGTQADGGAPRRRNRHQRCECDGARRFRDHPDAICGNHGAARFGSRPRPVVRSRSPGRNRH